MKLAVETAGVRGCRWPCILFTEEGMRRAILAGAETIEHGNEGTPAIFEIDGRASCGALPYVDGGRRNTQARSGGEAARHISGTSALAGVTILSGSDVGTLFPHGDNAREIERMAGGLRDAGTRRLSPSGYLCCRTRLRLEVGFW